MLVWDMRYNPYISVRRFRANEGTADDPAEAHVGPGPAEFYHRRVDTCVELCRCAASSRTGALVPSSGKFWVHFTA